MGGLFGDGGATLLEKLYVCRDSDVRRGAGDGDGGALSLGRGYVGLHWWDASG